MNDPGGLRAPDTVGVSASQAQQLEEFWSTHDEMEIELHVAGFPAEMQPPYACPRLTPEMLSTINNQAYGDIYQRFEAWHDYALNLYRRIQAVILGRENQLDDLDANLRGSLLKSREGDKRPNAQELKDFVILNPSRRELALSLQKLQQQELMMRSYVEKYERTIRMISRQVEIRRQDLDGKMMGVGIPNRAAGMRHGGG